MGAEEQAAGASDPLIVAAAHGLAFIVLRFVSLVASLDVCAASAIPWPAATVWILGAAILSTLAVGSVLKEGAGRRWSRIAAGVLLAVTVLITAAERGEIYGSSGEGLRCDPNISMHAHVLTVDASDLHVGLTAVLLGLVLARLARRGAFAWLTAAPLLIVGVGCFALSTALSSTSRGHWPLGSDPACHAWVRHAKMCSVLEDLLVVSVLLSCAVAASGGPGRRSLGAGALLLVAVAGFVATSRSVDPTGLAERQCWTGWRVAELIDPRLDTSRQGEHSLERCDESPHLLAMAEDLGEMAVVAVDASGSTTEAVYKKCPEDRRPCTLVLIADDRAPLVKIREHAAAYVAAGFESVQFVFADRMPIRHRFLKKRPVRACVCRWTTSKTAIELLSTPGTSWIEAMSAICTVPEFPRELLNGRGASND